MSKKWRNGKKKKRKNKVKKSKHEPYIPTIAQVLKWDKELI